MRRTVRADLCTPIHNWRRGPGSGVGINLSPGVVSPRARGRQAIPSPAAAKAAEPVPTAEPAAAPVVAAKGPKKAEPREKAEKAERKKSKSA